MLYEIYSKNKQILNIKLSNLDIFTLPVNIAYLYDSNINIDIFLVSLEKLLDIFPFLYGRMKSSYKNNFVEYYVNCTDKPIILNYNIIKEKYHIHNKNNNITKYIDSVNIKIIDTDNPLINFRITNFLDKSILGISISHVLGDGFTIFHIINNLSELYKLNEFNNSYTSKRNMIVDENFYNLFSIYLKKGIKENNIFEMSKNNGWIIMNKYKYVNFFIKAIYNMCMCRQYIIKLTYKEIMDIKYSEINNLQYNHTYDIICAFLFNLVCKTENYRESFSPKSIISVVNFRKYFKNSDLGNYTITSKADIKVFDLKCIANNVRKSINSVNKNIIKSYILDYERLRRQNFIDILFLFIYVKYRF